MARRRLFVTGGGGRLGRLLRHCWKAADLGVVDPVFLGRKDWNILEAPPPVMTQDDIILDLAGIIRGDIAENPRIAGRVALAAADAGATLVHMSSAAVYRGGNVPMAEDDIPHPHSAYGQSKRDAELEVLRVLPTAHILRLANVAGADALLSNLQDRGPVILDPVPGQPGGPIRSYIGPMTFAEVMRSLCQQIACGKTLPPVVNIAQPGPVRMEDLLTLSGHPWSFGPLRDGVLAQMVLKTEILQDWCTVPSASAAGLLEEITKLGKWP